MIRTPQDYRDVTYEYLSSCAAEGAIYVELIASPDHAAAVGLSDAEHFGGDRPGDRRRARATTGSRPGSSSPRSATSASRRPRRSPAATPTTATPTSSASTWPATRRASRRRQFARAYEIAAGSGLGCTRPRRRARGPRVGARGARRCRSRASPTACARSRIRRSWRSSPSAGIVLEVCPTLNVATRRLSELRGPSDSVRSGTPGCGSRSALTTLPTSACSIGREYAVARERIGFDEEELREITRTRRGGEFRGGCGQGGPLRQARLPRGSRQRLGCRRLRTFYFWRKRSAKAQPRRRSIRGFRAGVGRGRRRMRR